MSIPASSDGRPGSIDDLVRRAIPAGTEPTGWCHMPIHRHVLDNAPDVIDMTREGIAGTFGETPHVVVVLRSEDLAADPESDVSQMLALTQGGVLIVGIGYRPAEPAQ